MVAVCSAAFVSCLRFCKGRELVCAEPKSVHHIYAVGGDSPGLQSLVFARDAAGRYRFLADPVTRENEALRSLERKRSLYPTLRQEVIVHAECVGEVHYCWRVSGKKSAHVCSVGRRRH